MIIQREFLNKIKDFGLNSYEAQLWAALLSRGVATAGELSDIANVPRSRSYDVLESLERKGFIVVKIGKPLKYIAVSPGEVIHRVKKNIQEEAKKQEEIIDELKKTDVLNNLLAIYKQGIDVIEPSELTGVIKGRKNIYYHLAAMIKSAQKSVLLITTENGVLRKSDLLHNIFKKISEKKVSVQIIAPFSKTNADCFKKLSSVAELKKTNSVNMRLCVVDGKSALVFAADDEKTHINNDFAIWLNAGFAVKGFENMFDVVWKASEQVTG